MNSDLLAHPAYREARQAIAELSLISHGPTQSYDSDGRGSSEEPGGQRPPGEDWERQPKRADEEDRAAWAESYLRKNPAYFVAKLEQCETVGQLEAVRDECRGCVWSWRRRPSASRPLDRKDPHFKLYVATCGRDVGELAREFLVTRRYINKIRAMDWSALTDSQFEMQEAIKKENAA